MINLGQDSRFPWRGVEENLLVTLYLSCSVLFFLTPNNLQDRKSVLAFGINISYITLTFFYFSFLKNRRGIVTWLGPSLCQHQ
jgi:hypothetical protein